MNKRSGALNQRPAMAAVSHNWKDFQGKLTYTSNPAVQFTYFLSAFVEPTRKASWGRREGNWKIFNQARNICTYISTSSVERLWASLGIEQDQGRELGAT